MDSIFIVGTGRSGTHFTCRALRGFNNIYEPLEGKESEDILKDIAISSIHHHDYPKNAINYYKNIKKRCPPNKIFLDQHHSNIFYVNDLQKIFKAPIFIYPDRPIEQIVASMLRHRGVLHWFDYAKQKRKNFIPVENQFLGIQDLDQLHKLKLHELCALRAIAHRNRACIMKNRGINIRFINYENLVNDQIKEFKSIFTEEELILMGDFDIVEKGKASSLKKFVEILNEKEISEIQNLYTQFGR